jgi:c(7)-type cytochrome triheme protein
VAAAWPAQPAERGGDILYESGGGPGPVVFRHSTHDTPDLRCSTCHTRLFPFRHDTRITHVAMRAGQQCGACHDGARAFSTEAESACRLCHK